MKSHVFIAWLGEQLQNISQAPIENNARVDAIALAVKTAMPIIESMSKRQRQHIRKMIEFSSISGALGGFQIPFDDRDIYDYLEAFLTTIEGFLD